MKTNPPFAPASRREKLEQQVFVLVRRCPVDRKNPCCCPLCEVRQLAARARRRWVQGLTLKELRYLARYHTVCARERTRVFC